MLRKLCIVLLLILSANMFSQENYAVSAIPQELLENANAVLRDNRHDVVIPARNSMKITEHRVVTVLNESGLSFVGAYAYFDERTHIKSIEAFIYDKEGKQIKKIKRKEFKDVSVSSDSDITDNRVLHLDYTPVSYPFTVVFNCETQSENTAFLPQWAALEAPFFSTQHSECSFTVEPSLGFRYAEYNFKDIKLESGRQLGAFYFRADNIPAARTEDESPSFAKMKPFVLFSLEKFHLEGVDGEAKDWAAMGNWMYNSLLAGTDELPQETITKIKGLTANETDLLKKAKIVYEYVQGKTRYVSIQLGIGGWKPMKAKDVDRLGYGDCKALTNYTRALLAAVGVPSYYTVVYSGAKRRDFTTDFVSMQGDHIILAIPYNNNFIWLECTSQSMPFGFQGDFTDNRMVLLVKPEKGELVRTHVYETSGNSCFTKGNYAITGEGVLTGGITRISKGLEYDDKFGLITLSPDDLSKHYKSEFGRLNSLKLKKSDVKNNSDQQLITEELQLEAPMYCSNSGGRLIFTVNAFNQLSYVPARYRNRKMPLEIQTGYTMQDDVTITLPEGYVMEAMPQNVQISDKFGEYKAEFSLTGSQLHYKRLVTINNGTYPREDYDKYREFRDKIARNENAKAVLVKK